MSSSSSWGAELPAPGIPTSRAASRAPSPLPISRANSPAPRAGGAGRYLGKHLRKLSTSLPHYAYTPSEKTAEFYRGSGNAVSRVRGLVLRRPRVSGVLFLVFATLMYVSLLVHHNPVSNKVRAVSGGSKFVIILAANQGGGVMTWKGPKEWAVERDSIANKKAYAERWGYHLEIKDMSTKKRYAHEWRESWEKVDVIKQTMRQHPKAEW